MVAIHTSDQAEPEHLGHILARVMDAIIDRTVATSCQHVSRDRDCRRQVDACTTKNH
ncbi:MAG TPA: hypothetical protein VGM05_10470 [Planctomycetaceae bacterium]